MRPRHSGIPNSRLILFVLLILVIILIKFTSSRLSRNLEQRASQPVPEKSSQIPASAPPQTQN